MKEQLTHILDQSVCLSRKQMKEYLSGSMLPEETHAAELHISSCPLCSMAMDGFQEHSEDALAAIASLNSGFLKEHFDNIAPQIHLNSMAPSAALSGSNRRRTTAGAWLRPVGVAAGLLLICAAAWYLASSSGDTLRDPDLIQTPASQAVEPAQAAPSQTAAAPVVSSTASHQGTSPQTLATPVPAITNPAAKPAKATRPAQDPAARQSDAHSGNARYYQPDLIPTDIPASTENAAATALPSANDASKTYQGDINYSTKKMYVPPASEPDAAAAVAPGAAKPPVTKPLSADPATPPASKPAAKRSDESSDQLFERGEYRSALTKYRQQLKSSDVAVRSHANLQAARCYAALGEPERAEALLRKVLEEGSGKERRAARRLLRNLE